MSIIRTFRDGDLPEAKSLLAAFPSDSLAFAVFQLWYAF